LQVITVQSPHTFEGVRGLGGGVGDFFGTGGEGEALETATFAWAVGLGEEVADGFEGEENIPPKRPPFPPAVGALD